MTLSHKPIAFAKMSGAGNDFILIDNRDGRIGGEAAELARRVCLSRISLGADGLILIEKSDQADFGWRFFNSDGSTAEMCGNGARCAARFAYSRGIAECSMCFQTLAGIIAAEILEGEVAIDLTPPGPLEQDLRLPLSKGTVRLDVIDTGVPHAVIFVDELEGLDVVGTGREIRRHSHFAPAGTNVNFALIPCAGHLKVRTYERGVEDETMACGTGLTAASLAAAARFGWKSPIKVETRGGFRLTVGFQMTPDGFERVRLQGEARMVCEGDLGVDAWLY